MSNKRQHTTRKDNESCRVKLLWDDKESVDLAMNKGAVIKQTPLLVQERITLNY
jgi:hypothetical protein